jgi:aflatoxin B1 aldehyde reductase
LNRRRPVPFLVDCWLIEYALRAVEPELFKCLANYGIRFHAFNPLAGGAFSKNFGASAAVAAGSRFDGSTAQGKVYRNRYMNDAYLDALAEIHRSCEGHGLDMTLSLWRCAG